MCCFCVKNHEEEIGTPTTLLGRELSEAYAKNKDNSQNHPWKLSATTDVQKLWVLKNTKRREHVPDP